MADSGEEGDFMYPLIDKQATGRRIRKIMDKKGITVRNIQEFLGLACVQSIYHWLDGTSLPSLDNLYALSELLQVPMDRIVCGKQKSIDLETVTTGDRLLIAYYHKMKVLYAA